jgi:aminopeptidase-like protein
MISSYLNSTSQNGDMGTGMHRLVTQLYPICRSITGEGVRQTLRILQQHIPLSIHEVPTGTSVFDWVIPKEWNISSAYVNNPSGNRIIDFKESNLHVLNYSIPINKKMGFSELKPHLHTIPEHPDWIPYRTSYYGGNWGFCLSHRQYEELTEGQYEVCIDSSLTDGSLTYGEYYIKGRIPEEILISTHICHPSLCNDNLSGIALSTFLAKALSNSQHEYSYRFLFIPGTIGSIAWLSLNENNLAQIKHGLVAACVGDCGRFTYKKSRQQTATIDRTVQKVLKDRNIDYAIEDFIPYGYDERQYCSPGINLPIGCLMRTPYGRYPEYHTSADDIELVQPEYLGESFVVYHSIFYVLENDKKYVNLNPKCEPQLGSRGLYNQIGGEGDQNLKQLSMLWVLNLSDGTNSLLDIAERSDIRFDLIKKAANILEDNGLLEENDET